MGSLNASNEAAELQT